MNTNANPNSYLVWLDNPARENYLGVWQGNSEEDVVAAVKGAHKKRIFGVTVPSAPIVQLATLDAVTAGIHNGTLPKEM